MTHYEVRLFCPIPDGSPKDPLDRISLAGPFRQALERGHGGIREVRDGIYRPEFGVLMNVDTTHRAVEVLQFETDLPLEDFSGFLFEAFTRVLHEHRLLLHRTGEETRNYAHDSAIDFKSIPAPVAV